MKRSTTTFDRVSGREASGGEDDTLLGNVESFRGAASAHLFRDSSQKMRAFEKVSPAGYCQLAICMTPHQGRVTQNGRLSHSGRILRGGVNLYRPGEHVAVNTQGPWEMLLLFLQDHLLKNVSDDVGLRYKGAGDLEVMNPGFQLDLSILNASERIAQSIAKAEPFSSFRMDLASQEIALQVLSVHSSFVPGARTSLARNTHKGLAPGQLKRACDAMSDLHARDVSLSTLALASGCSPTHFSRAFKASTGLSPFEWLLRRRIDRAKTLLLQQGRSLSDVALDVGFAAQPQFTTAFRRVTGQTPGRWRKFHTE